MIPAQGTRESFIRIGNEEFLASNLNILGLNSIGNNQACCGRSGPDFHTIGDDAEHTGILLHKVDIVGTQFLPVAAQNGNSVIGGKRDIALQDDAAHIRTGETAASDLVRRKDTPLAEDGHIQKPLGVALFAERDIAHFKVVTR